MAKKSSNNKKGKWKKYFSNRRMISLEALLLVGFFENYIENQVVLLDAPYWVHTVIIMLLIAGTFGSLVTIITAFTKHSLTHGQKVINALPIPTPMLLVHGGIFFGIFWIYHLYW